MNRIIASVFVALLLPTLIAPSAVEAARTVDRWYYGGVGGVAGVHAPLCFNGTSKNVNDVCFALLADETQITITIFDDYPTLPGAGTPLPVAGSLYFESALNLPMSDPVSFCGASDPIPIPEGAAFARVFVGPLANATLNEGCLPGVGRMGYVRADIV